MNCGPKSTTVEPSTSCLQILIPGKHQVWAHKKKQENQLDEYISLTIDRILRCVRDVYLLNLALKVLALNKVGDIILLIILLLTALRLLHVLVALGELAEGGQGVGAELVQDTGDELGELLLLAVAVQGEGVGGDGGVN